MKFKFGYIQNIIGAKQPRMGLNPNNRGCNPWNERSALYNNPEGVEYHLFSGSCSTPSGLDRLSDLFPRFHRGLFTFNPRLHSGQAFRVALTNFMVENKMIHKS